MKIQHIGTHKIIAPKKALTFLDGQDIAKKHVEPLTDAFLSGGIQIAFLIPDNTPVETVKGDRSIPSYFYTGLFEKLFEKVRDTRFSETKVTAARHKIKAIGGSDFESPDVMEILKEIFDNQASTFGELEDYLRTRIHIGLLHSDGSYTLAEYDEERMMQEVADEEMNNKLFMFSYMYYKALDGMFSNDFGTSVLIQRDIDAKSLSI